MSTKIYNNLAIIFIFTIILGSSIPSASDPNSYIFSSDKLLHIIEYFILGFFLFNSLIKKTEYPGFLCLLLGTIFALVMRYISQPPLGEFLVLLMLLLIS